MHGEFSLRAFSTLHTSQFVTHTQRQIRHLLKEKTKHNPGRYCPDISPCVVLTLSCFIAAERGCWHTKRHEAPTERSLCRVLIKNLGFAPAFISEVVKRVREREFGNRCNHVARVGY